MGTFASPGIEVVVQVRLLGPVDVMVQGAPLEVPGLRRRAVLATLALRAGDVVGVDQLTEVVWGGASAPPSANTLQSHISYLRRLLGGKSMIVSRPPGYVLKLGEDGTDVHVAERLLRQGTQAADPAEGARLLASADELWRGEPLADLTGLVWLEEQAAHLDLLHVKVKRARAEARLAAGEHARLLPELEQLAADHPLDEQMQATLMLALYRCGRQADALAVLHRLRRELDERLGVEPSQPLRDLEVAILRQDPALDPTYSTITVPAQPESGQPPSAQPESAEPPSAQPEPAQAPPAQPVPAQLPSAVPGFAGRLAELGALDAIRTAAVRPGSDTPATVIISAVSGTAGVGKTALAVHWARQVSKHFPDGQLFVNLRGYGPDDAALSAATAVSGFLDALGVPPTRIPDSLEAQTALYRSLLSGRRVLVVLDNARDADQVRPLLPGSPGCLALVTSRQELAGLVAAEGAQPLRLDLLTAGDARDLLARRLGEARVAGEPTAVDDIVAGCARLPLALSIAAARAAINPGFPLAAVATGLREAGRALDPLESRDQATDVRAVFSWSYRALSADAASLFRLLGWFPGPDISIRAAASLAAVGVDRARALLAELTSANLLTEHRPSRYASHDLLRAYAAELAREHDSPQVIEHAVRRVLEHYLYTAQNAVILLEPYFHSLGLPPPQDGVVVSPLDSAGEAKSWFAAERDTLRAAVHLGADAGLNVLAWQLAWAQTVFPLRNGSWDEQALVQRVGLAAARRIGDQVGEAHLVHRLAAGYALAGRVGDADRLFRQALEQFGLIGDPANQAIVLSSMTVLCSRQERPADALEYSLRSHDLFRRAGHQAGQVLALNDIGYAHAMLGNYQEALSYCQRAIAAIGELGNNNWEACAWDSIGYIHNKLGDHQQAVSCYQRAIDLHRTGADRFREADTLRNLAEVWRSAGDPCGACRVWRQALAIFEEIGHPDGETVRAQLASACRQDLAGTCPAALSFSRAG